MGVYYSFADYYTKGNQLSNLSLMYFMLGNENGGIVGVQVAIAALYCIMNAFIIICLHNYRTTMHKYSKTHAQSGSGSNDKHISKSMHRRSSLIEMSNSSVSI